MIRIVWQIVTRITNEILGEEIKEGPFIVKTIGTNPGLKGNVCLIFSNFMWNDILFVQKWSFPTWMSSLMNYSERTGHVMLFCLAFR